MHCDDDARRRAPARSSTRASRRASAAKPGAHGKDTRGLYRVHQFTKVEQVVFCAPDEAVAEKDHYELLGNAEAILAKLEIPYRVAIACTGEIGLGQTRKHEVESWMPGRNAYSETHSCSTLGDFQARRSNIRVRTAGRVAGLPVHPEQHRHREPAHPHPPPREPPERRRLGHPPEGARPVHELEDRPHPRLTPLFSIEKSRRNAEDAEGRGGRRGEMDCGTELARGPTRGRQAEGCPLSARPNPPHLCVLCALCVLWRFLQSRRRAGGPSGGGSSLTGAEAQVRTWTHERTFLGSSARLAH